MIAQFSSWSTWKPSSGQKTGSPGLWWRVKRVSLEDRRRSRKLQSSLFRIGPSVRRSRRGRLISCFFSPSPPPPFPLSFPLVLLWENCVHKSADTIMSVLTFISRHRWWKERRETRGALRLIHYYVKKFHRKYYTNILNNVHNNAKFEENEGKMNRKNTLVRIY